MLPPVLEWHQIIALGANEAGPETILSPCSLWGTDGQPLSELAVAQK